jgi:hypothetical protein
MSHDHLTDETFDDAELSAELDDADDEFEEITSDEVDRVVESLDQLIQTVESENIRWLLEDAAGKIFSLIYDDEVDHDQAAGEAA